MILITTKKGKADTLKFTLNASQGVGEVGHFMDLLNTQQYLQMRHEAFANDGIPFPSISTNPSDIKYDVNGVWDTTRNTNWQKAMIGGTAQWTNINGDLSGGTTNALFVNPMVAPLFKRVIMNEFLNESEYSRETRKELIEQVKVLNTRITKARELLWNGDIDNRDYKEIKAHAETKIADLEWRVMELKSNHVPVIEVEAAIDGALETLANLRVIYCGADRPTQKRIIGSMFAEKFKFEDLQLRTAQLSDVFK